MSSDQPEQPPAKQAVPFHRPYPTFANHINDLLRGRLFLQDSLSTSSPIMSSTDSADSDESAVNSGPPPRRALPTLAEADERRRRRIAAMTAQYPSSAMRIPEAPTTSDPQIEGLHGFSKELESILDAKREQNKRYEEFHIEWIDLQKKLHKKSDELRAQYADLIEQVHNLHHKLTRDHIKIDDYTSARESLDDQMDEVFENLGKVVVTLGMMYAESRAVAQGANPSDYSGKLDAAACDAVPFLIHNFPEFAKKKPSEIPPDPFGPRPADTAFENDLPSYDFSDMMTKVWSKHPTKLQDIYHAVYDQGFAGIKELTQKDKDNANSLLGNGGEWSI